MKKLFICFLISLLILTGCNKKEEPKKTIEDDTVEIDYNIKGLNEIITYKILDNYEHSDSYYLTDYDDEIKIKDADKIMMVDNYGSKEDDGYFSVAIYSYKGKDPTNDFNNIDVKDFIQYLVKTTKMTIDNHEFTIGYSGGDDIEDMNARAFVVHNDYVIEFTESNFDERITEKQYNEFIEILKTVKFN